MALTDYIPQIDEGWGKMSKHDRHKIRNGRLEICFKIKLLRFYRLTDLILTDQMCAGNKVVYYGRMGF